MSTFERMDLTQFDGITPGPWWAGCSSQRGHTVWGAGGGVGSMQIAACGHAGFDQRNAALIAAAPDLLDALRSAYAEIARLTAENAALREQVPVWITVQPGDGPGKVDEATLPPMNERVLAYPVRDGVPRIVWRCSDRVWTSANTYAEIRPGDSWTHIPEVQG